ncbi:protein of unknown function [Acinetobacter marinus]|uniref:DUF4189 domain-containing protein n=1 Tax=Acinetobacter marinus TaxID=281375 RepID=A0A1G6IFN9_9GAMM|nr:DUF4189 domain-containing protein [Acinetobacter marinus]SDC05377.1 protein of unknown function [Acinetobacter marinus]
MKTNLLITTAGFIAILGFSANLAVAQYVPQGAKHQIATQGAQQPTAPQARWADRWGAFASDGKTYGIVADANSERKAKSNAIAECEKNGGNKCQHRFTYRSQCAAIAASERNKFFSGAPDAKEAEETAIKRCETANGKGACWLYYSGCSLPVRIQ